MSFSKVKIVTMMLAFMSAPSFCFGQTSQKLPVMGVWIWSPYDLLGNKYKARIDEMSANYPYDLIISFLRFPNYEITSDTVHNKVKDISIYAKAKGIGIAADLDIRNARKTFMEKYPDELQQMIRIKSVKAGTQRIVFTPIDLSDHYSDGYITHHKSVASKLKRVYAYRQSNGNIDPKTLIDITYKCKILCSTADSLIVELPPKIGKGASDFSAIVAFSHLYPDVFSPHLLSFQRELIQQYADVPLAGVCKDEWGFPPYFPRYYKQGYTDYWYSPSYDAAYKERTGRELLFDCLLMSQTIKGKITERQVAVNNYTRLGRERNIVIEKDYYNSVKKIFGKDAFVTVHSTWWPFPDKNESKKNGLDWWATKRDLAQTDEVVPFSVRTALCKKWGSPVWYNMYYKSDLQNQIWSSALAGGRLNYLSYNLLNKNNLLKAENKVHLLNYISHSPLNCPVAVIFGHQNALNWAGTGFEDVGMELVDSLWHAGYPADLIPTSEIENGSLKVDAEGYVCYGKQKYAAIVLYQPQFENNGTADFFKNVKSKTSLFLIGNWKNDCNGNLVKTEKMLSDKFIKRDNENIVSSILNEMVKRNIRKNSPALGILDNTYFKLRDFNHLSVVPSTSGFSRLIDGTFIKIAATNNPEGDPIFDFMADDYPVKVEARGVVAVRFNKKGSLIAMAAGDLSSFDAGNLKITLFKKCNIALEKNTKGKWIGYIQSEDGIIPPELLNITYKWKIIK